MIAVMRPSRPLCNTSSCMQLRAAKQCLTRLAKENSQQRFTPADLASFLALLPGLAGDPALEAGPSNPPNQEGSQLVRTHSEGEEEEDDEDSTGLRQMADLSYVPEERRGGVREKRSRQGIRAMLRAQQHLDSTGQTRPPFPSEASPDVSKRCIDACC